MENSICFILPGWLSKNTGGAEWQLYNIANKFIDSSWTVEVITKKGFIKNKIYLKSNIKYYYYVPKIFKSRLLGFFYFLLILFKTKSKYYYIRTDARMERAALYIFSKIRKKKYFYSIASDNDIKNLKYNSFLKKKNLKNMIKKLDNYLIDYFGNISFKNSIIICQNYNQSNYIFQNYKLKSYVVFNSYFGTIISQNEINKKSNIVLWVGNMRAVKRPELMISLIRQYKGGWEFRIIGEVGNYFEEIKKIDNSNFKYLGTLKHDKLIQEYRAAKVLINTSMLEGFSNTFLEAWANGVWIISLGVDPDNIIKKYGFGDICNNIDEVKNKLYKYEKNGINTSKLLEARNFVKKNFSFEKNFEILKNIILKG